MIETLGPVTTRPEQHDCPDCPCCTAELCQRGRVSIHRCAGLTPGHLRRTVNSCPCSAAFTAGTHAWRLERVRVARRATERPFPPTEEIALRELAAGGEPRDRVALARLRVAGMVAEDDGRHIVTDSGRLYLAVRRDHRFVTPVEVLTVDVQERTARVVVVGWHLSEPVTVLLDQLIADTGLGPEYLPGTFLEAEANCHADRGDDLVLTRVCVALPLPEEIDASGETAQEPGDVAAGDGGGRS